MGIECHANDLMSEEVTANSNMQCRMYSESCTWSGVRLKIGWLVEYTQVNFCSKFHWNPLRYEGVIQQTSLMDKMKSQKINYASPRKVCDEEGKKNDSALKNFFKKVQVSKAVTEDWLGGFEPNLGQWFYRPWRYYIPSHEGSRDLEVGRRALRAKSVIANALGLVLRIGGADFYQTRFIDSTR